MTKSERSPKPEIVERLLKCHAGLSCGFGQFISKWTAHPNLVALDCDRAILKGLCGTGFGMSASPIGRKKIAHRFTGGFWCENRKRPVRDGRAGLWSLTFSFAPPCPSLYTRYLSPGRIAGDHGSVIL